MSGFENEISLHIIAYFIWPVVFYTLQKKGGSCTKKLCIFAKPKLNSFVLHLRNNIYGGKLFGISYSKNMANFIKPKLLISEECL